MTYEESKNLWKLEMLSFKESEKSGNVTPELKKLYNTVDKLINAGSLQYYEFCNDMAEELRKAGDGEPTEVINTVALNLIDKYNGR